MTQTLTHPTPNSAGANPLFPLSPEAVRALLARAGQNAAEQQDAA